MTRAYSGTSSCANTGTSRFRPDRPTRSWWPYVVHSEMAIPAPGGGSPWSTRVNANGEYTAICISPAGSPADGTTRPLAVLPLGLNEAVMTVSQVSTTSRFAKARNSRAGAMSQGSGGEEHADDVASEPTRHAVVGEAKLDDLVRLERGRPVSPLSLAVSLQRLDGCGAPRAVFLDVSPPAAVPVAPRTQRGEREPVSPLTECLGDNGVARPLDLVDRLVIASGLRRQMLISHRSRHPAVAAPRQVAHGIPKIVLATRSAASLCIGGVTCV